ncbi:MAG TPA: glucoamylase family protein [Candidatus Acidoferrales bacterium]|nr:glucoamylase family protein [Candidatus Acidoferrales bacterium]
MDEIERTCFCFFWEQGNSGTGLVKDRSLATGHDDRPVASIAATGFGLTAMAIADRRGWEKRERLLGRIRTTLQFALNRIQHEHGFLLHFVDHATGARAFNSEFSSIDTTILLCGALTCRAYFDDPEVRALATQLYERADWVWLLNGGMLLSHGYRLETGFIKSRWDEYSELMMIYLLGLGSPTHALPAETWDAWKRVPLEYDGIRIIGSNAPIFVHQYSHAWFDFRNRRDRYADYFRNSIDATRIHKLFCLALASKFPDYTEDLWGITASDSAKGYVVWGGPPPMGPIDGTVVPSAAGGSLPFLPAETLRVLRNMRQKYSERGWKRYGFVDAFNPLTGWYDPDVIGINLGILMLMAENLRSSFVWDVFMRNHEAKLSMERAGFESTQWNASSRVR